MATTTRWTCDRCKAVRELPEGQEPPNWMIAMTLRPPWRDQKIYDLCFKCVKSWFEWLDGHTMRAELMNDVVELVAENKAQNEAKARA